MPKHLKTTVDVIDALGGNIAISRVLGVHHKAVGNWRYSGEFPANSYLVLQGLLREQGFTAPNQLWAMKQRSFRPRARKHATKAKRA